jgi:RNA polymerase sigma-70 factor (ECF subfamily)
VTVAEKFEVFLLEFQDMVYATAVRLLGNPAEAEDVAQTVFLKAFERFDQLDGNPSAPGWLKTVATNECLNHLARYRNRWRLFSELGTHEGSPILARGQVPDTQEDYRALDAALRGLPAAQRVPIVLFHFDELSYQQIADRLGVSLSKVKTDIHRGREALRAVLAPAERPVGWEPAR